MKLWKATGHKAYFDYVYQWGDTLVGKNGSIYSYKRTDYTLDFINSGKVLFDLYDETREPRFRMALDTLIKQFDGQPRTSEGGFWHKLIYPHQMWLDGLYMASPFMASMGLLSVNRRILTKRFISWSLLPNTRMMLKQDFFIMAGMKVEHNVGQILFQAIHAVSGEEVSAGMPWLWLMHLTTFLPIILTGLLLFDCSGCCPKVCSRIRINRQDFGTKWLIRAVGQVITARLPFPA